MLTFAGKYRNPVWLNETKQGCFLCWLIFFYNKTNIFVKIVGPLEEVSLFPLAIYIECELYNPLMCFRLMLHIPIYL